MNGIPCAPTEALSNTTPSDFLKHLAQVFAVAEIEYSVIHGLRQELSDSSDIDLVINHEQRKFVDVLIRSGVLGHCRQCIWQDIPWSKYYVIYDESEKREQVLDITLDPWGLGAYGATPQFALSRRVKIAGVWTSALEAELLYVALKAERKGNYGNEVDERLRSLAGLAEADVVPALERLAGEAGRMLGAALSGEGEQHRPSLREARRALARSNRVSPLRLSRRVGFSLTRAFARLRRPTGFVLVLDAEPELRVAVEQELVAKLPRSFRRGDVLPAGARDARRKRAGVTSRGEIGLERRPAASNRRDGQRLVILADGFDWPLRIRLLKARSSLVLLPTDPRAGPRTGFEASWGTQPRHAKLAERLSTIPDLGVDIRVTASATCLTASSRNLDSYHGFESDAQNTITLAGADPSRIAQGVLIMVSRELERRWAIPDTRLAEYAASSVCKQLVTLASR